jgi:hypothetical protein
MMKFLTLSIYLAVMVTFNSCGSSSNSVISDNAPPQFIGFRDRLVLPEKSSYQLRAYDNSEPVTFELLDAPEGITLNGDTITIPSGVGKEYHLRVTATDAKGNKAEQNLTIFSVLPDDVNIPLEFKLLDNDDRYTWEQAVKMCQEEGEGWSLPTIWQFSHNSQRVYDLVKDIDSDLNSQNGDQGFVSAIWSIERADEPSAGLLSKAWWYKPNSQPEEIEDPIEGENREDYFVVCVHKK